MSRYSARPITSSSPVVVIVDDDPGVLELLGRLAVQSGFQVRQFAGGDEALKFLASRRAHLVFVDVNMPEVSGLEVLRTIQGTDPHCHVVMMSGDVTVETAVETIKQGAVDFISKPFHLERVRAFLESEAAEMHRRRRLLTVERRLVQDLVFCGMIGRSAAISEVFALIRRTAPHARSAVVLGETGTGKELVARALHDLGPRASGPFVTVNCSAIVDTLFESELFGHRRGAFTGAVDHKAGLFEQAHGGTLFLDEVGELSLAVQGKLLRVLETGELQRVGDVARRNVDVRIVAATNRALREEAAAGRFRSDLYYRLALIEIDLPPLRERREDIPLLVAAFVQSAAARLEKRVLGTTIGAERLLVAAPWQGNVRELRNVIERACILTDAELLSEREVLQAMPGRQDLPREEPAADAVPRATEPPDSMTAFEHAHVTRVLREVGGNRSAAAQRLGLSRRALYRRLDRLGIATI